MSEAVLPPPAPLAAALLSEHVESKVDEQGRRRFQVRALFNKQGGGAGHGGGRGTCVTLHAFRETEERRASCLTEVTATHRHALSLLSFLSLTFASVSQPPGSLCVATLTLPDHWFEEPLPQRPHQGLEGRSFSSSNSVLSRRRRVQRQNWRRSRRHHWASSSIRLVCLGHSVGRATRAPACCLHALSIFQSECADAEVFLM